MLQVNGSWALLPRSARGPSLPDPVPTCPGLSPACNCLQSGLSPIWPVPSLHLSSPALAYPPPAPVPNLHLTLAWSVPICTCPQPSLLSTLGGGQT